MRLFGNLLKAHISASGRSISEWARTVGITQGFASNLLAGRRTPPLRELEAWADSFGIAGDERQRFIDLAAIAHLPDTAQERLVALLDDAAGLRAQARLLPAEPSARNSGCAGVDRRVLAQRTTR
jgi:transcriptional regulator with XRE-family HTH domain